MTHRIYRIRLDAPGRLLVMPAPPQGTLDEVLVRLKEMGADKVISLLGTFEAEYIGLQQEGKACTRHGLAFSHYPIEDFGVPADGTFDDLVDDAVQRIEAGGGVAVHCRAGIGRAGMFSSCILQRFGHSADEAMAIVSASRRTQVPETPEQQAFVQGYKK